MATKLETRFAQIEANRKQLLQELKQYPDAVLNKNPAPGKWSVIQVLEHLMASEGASLRYLQKKTLDTSKAAPAGVKGAAKLLLTKAAFMLPIKFKAPEIMEPVTSNVSLKEAEEKWTSIRSGLYQLLSKLPEKDLDKEIWKHVVSGKMNAYQMIEFFNFHFKRHQGQIERTLAAVK